jgi:putative alpha-1,2-mannosidase
VHEDCPTVLSFPTSSLLLSSCRWPGNEPDLLAPWSFPFAGNEYATRTQHWVRWTLQTYYTAEARGMPGNDDYGARWKRGVGG